MIRFLTTRLWQRIAAVSKTAAAKRAAIAYVTRDLPLTLKSDDTLIVDASDSAIGSGQTSAAVLLQLYRRGVRLFHFGPLHSKVIVLDGRVFVSSANLSTSSQRALVEAGVETDDPASVAQAIAFIESLAEHSRPISEAFLRRIAKIPVTRNGHRNRDRAARKRLKLPRESTTWLVGVRALNETRDPAELKRIATGEKKAAALQRNERSEIWWIKHSGRSRFSKYSKLGDIVIVMWRERDAAKFPEIVYHHSPVLLNQPEPKHNRVYYEMPPRSVKPLRWNEFKALSKKVGLPSVSRNAVRELTPEQATALHELWEQSRKTK